MRRIQVVKGEVISVGLHKHEITTYQVAKVIIEGDKSNRQHVNLQNIVDSYGLGIGTKVRLVLEVQEEHEEILELEPALGGPQKTK